VEKRVVKGGSEGGWGCYGEQGEGGEEGGVMRIVGGGEREVGLKGK